MAYSINTYSVKKWDLGELFAGFDSPDLQAAFDNIEEQVASFEGVRGRLTLTRKRFSTWSAPRKRLRASSIECMHSRDFHLQLTRRIRTRKA